jgi:nitroreductase
MKFKIFLSGILFIAIIAGYSFCLHAQESEPLKLPQPRMSGGKPLMAALKDRQSLKSFSSAKLSIQVISDLLWAAWGINRADIGKRTAPTARNEQELDVYLINADGAFRYDAKDNSLKLIVKENLQGVVSKQKEVITAPVNLVFVADFDKMAKTPEKEKDFFSAIDTGYLSQNVYLFCASEGLSTFAYYGVDRPVMGEKLKLKPNQKIMLGQAVGYPGKSGN